MSQDKLLAKILHFSEGRTKALSSMLFGDKVRGKSRSEKDFIRTQYITFDSAELQKIEERKLYLALPEPSRSNLYGLITPRLELFAAESGASHLLSMPLVEAGDRIGVALAYLSLANEDKAAIQAFASLLPKCRKIFGDNINALEAYVHNYREALRDSKMIVSTAFSEISIRDEQPSIHPTWQNFIAQDKKRVAGKLLKDVESLDKPAPPNLEEALKHNANWLFPEVFLKIETLNEAELKNGVTKAKLREFVVEYYKHSLTSKIADDGGISLQEALTESVRVISSPNIKTKATDLMPDLNLPSYNALVKMEKARISKILGVEQGQEDALQQSEELSVAAAASEVDNSPKARSKDYYMSKLEPGDLRGFYLGKLVNCCQSMNGTGRDVARHGMNEIDSGFYVIQETENGKRNPQSDRIVAEFWTWLSDDGKSIVFDSFERLGMEHNKLCRLFINAVARELEGRYEYIGLGSSPTAGSPSFNMEYNETPVQMRKAVGYGLENKKVLCLDGETQNDVTQQIQVVDIVELSQLGFLDTDENLDSVLMHNKELGFRDEESIDRLGSEQLYYVGFALAGEQLALFNKLLKKWKVELKHYTKLYDLAQVFNHKTLQAFIDAGADVNIKDENGSMPMVGAAISKESLSILLENGIALHARSKEGYTLLLAAAKVDDIEVAKILLAAKVDVNGFCNKKTTPLHEAVRCSSSEMVKILIDAGADVGAIDKWGARPLDIAQSKATPNVKMIQILLNSAGIAEHQNAHTHNILQPVNDLPSDLGIQDDADAAFVSLAGTYETFNQTSHL